MGFPHNISTVFTATGESRATRASRTLDLLSEHARTIDGIRAGDVEAGDRLVVRTRHSLYTLTALGNGVFRVAGGWFAANAQESDEVRIVGCTWGGRAILTNLVAAPGMCIEFDNSVRTTSVRDVRLLRYGPSAVFH